MLAGMNNQTPWEGEHGKSVVSNRKSTETVPAGLHCDGREFRMLYSPTTYFPFSYLI